MIIESSHLFPVDCGNPATCCDESSNDVFFPGNFFIRPLYFNQPETKSKDTYRNGIICTGSPA